MKDMKKLELASIRAAQMKIIRPELDEKKTIIILYKGMTKKELEKAIKA
jgi:hypothetical protein